MWFSNRPATVHDLSEFIHNLFIWGSKETAPLEAGLWSFYLLRI